MHRLGPFVAAQAERIGVLEQGYRPIHPDDEAAAMEHARARARTHSSRSTKSGSTAWNCGSPVTRMPRRGPGAVAVIPARGGSKGIPGKNLARVGGQPLVARAVQTAQRSRGISHVVVSTDSPDIAVVAEAAGAEVVDRPADIAGDAATSESAVLHALSALGPDNVPPVTVLIQCTSPFIPHEALGRGIDLVATDETDVVFSVVPTHAFLWRPDRVVVGRQPRQVVSPSSPGPRTRVSRDRSLLCDAHGRTAEAWPSLLRACPGCRGPRSHCA